MSKFKAGDKVVCISGALNSSSSFTKGKTYTVGGKYHNWEAGRVGIILDDSGRENGWMDECFKLVEDKEKIETTFCSLGRLATTRFSTERFKKIIDETVSQINELSEKKGGEYASGDDRLINFRRNAENLGLTKEDVWSVYAGKHWDAIMTYVKDNRSGIKRERLESISGRCDDMIVYLLLFKAMIEENGD